jgi:hypothetical protein
LNCSCAALNQCWISLMARRLPSRHRGTPRKN